jgi:hypothetical protein
VNQGRASIRLTHITFVFVEVLLALTVIALDAAIMAAMIVVDHM